MTSNTSRKRTEGDPPLPGGGLFEINHDTWPSYSDYQPLKRNKREIRLLTIDCSAVSEDIVCTLSQVPLSEANPFYALSYVWGPMRQSRSITLDGQRIRIRDNLWKFLRTIRTVNQEKIKVWVDCICIDQQNIAERNFEVSMMGDIFGSADSVYVWLGTSTVESEAAFSYVETAKSLRASGMPYWQIQDDNLDGLEALKDIVGRQYWTRLWIIQEVVLAKRLWIFCGSQYIGWEDLQLALTGNRVRNVIAKDTTCQENAKILRYFKKTREERAPSTLSELVHRFRYAQCQDPRDKIYGILSLAEQSSKSTVQIDYAKPLLQVLLETYSSWASDWALSEALVPSRVVSQEPSSASYSPSSFFQELSILFDETALESFYQDFYLREMVSAMITLRGQVENTPCVYQTIAIINTMESQVRPYSPAGIVQTSIDTGTSCYVTLVKMTARQLRFFIYTTTLPLAGDMIVNVAETILLMRSTPSDPQGHRSFVGRGIRLPYKLTEPLYGPCQFASQLLTDSIYTLAIDRETSNSIRPLTNHIARPIPSKSSIKEASVQLNAAALAESMRMSEIRNRKPSAEFHSGLWTWDVFNFGLQHQLLDMCRDCRVMYAAHSKKKVKDRDLDRLCSCVWLDASRDLIS